MKSSISQLTFFYFVLPSIYSVVPGIFLFLFIFFPSLLHSSSTRRRFYPQRPSGQAVVTGVVPSPPRYAPSILSRIGFSIPTARRFSSNVANSSSRAFRQSIFYARKKSLLYEYVHSVRIELAKLILVYHIYMHIIYRSTYISYNVSVLYSARGAVGCAHNICASFVRVVAHTYIQP